MSQWGRLDATFVGTEHLDRARVELDLPTGSESGPTVRNDGGTFYVSGRLRDVNDFDSPAVLAWFAGVCEYFVTRAELTWDLDRGPRYRYVWDGTNLTKLRGILD